MTDTATTRTWVCVACRARVPFDADACVSCGRAFAEGLGRPETRRKPAAWVYVLREVALLNLLFVVWRVVGHLSLLHSRGADSRGLWLWHAERFLHLPSEAALQRGVLGHPGLDRLLNGYYEYAHAPFLVGTLLWLLWRHRDRYGRWRNLTVAFTAVSLLIALIPVAPPRLLPQLGLVDLAMKFHQSVYEPLGRGITDQLSSMPSVHVGWAVLAAVAIISVSVSRWRWLAVAHPVLTVYTVVVTANHYWLDGVAAVALLAVLALAPARIRAARSRGSGVRTVAGTDAIPQPAS